MVVHYNQRVGVFVDVQNMYYSAKQLYGKKVNYANILKTAVAGRKLVRALTYVIKADIKEESNFFDALDKIGFEVKSKDLQIFFGGAKKGDWDVGIAMDIMKLANKLDVVILVSGDGDFKDLLEHVKALGCRAEVMAFGKTASSRIKGETDYFIDMDQHLDKFLIGDISKVHEKSIKKEDKDLIIPEIEAALLKKENGKENKSKFVHNRQNQSYQRRREDNRNRRDGRRQNDRRRPTGNNNRFSRKFDGPIKPRPKRKFERSVESSGPSLIDQINMQQPNPLGVPKKKESVKPLMNKNNSKSTFKKEDNSKKIGTKVAPKEMSINQKKEDKKPIAKKSSKKVSEIKKEAKKTSVKSGTKKAFSKKPAVKKVSSKKSAVKVVPKKVQVKKKKEDKSAEEKEKTKKPKKKSILKKIFK